MSESAADTAKTIPTKVDDIEDVDEPLRPFFNKVERDDGEAAWYLNTDRVEPAVNALNQNKQRWEEREKKWEQERGELTGRLESLTEKMEKISEGTNRKKDPADLEKLRDEMNSLAKERDDFKKKVEAFESKAAAERHRALLMEEFKEQDKVPLSNPGLQLAVITGMQESRREVDEDGNESLVFVSSRGERTGPQGEPLSALDWLQQKTKSEDGKEWLRESPGGSGSHASRSGGAKSISLRDMTPKQKAETIREKGMAWFNEALEREIQAERAEREGAERGRRSA